jgi:catechol 2,3-dioxygenase-like lactoylglutathione lyase family enzyme
MPREGPEPILLAHNMSQVRAFYESLGFVAGYHADNYEIVRRGNLVVHLELNDDLMPATNHTSCYWRVNDADILYQEFATLGLPNEGSPSLTTPSDEPWGMREFTLKDPAGNLIRVGHELHGRGHARQAEISGISPFFIVNHVPSSLAFYRDRLGFEITFQGPSPDDIFFGIVRRGGAQILLKAVGVAPTPNYTRDVKKGIARWDAFVYVPDPDALAAEFASRKIEFYEPLKNTHDGLRGFEVQDCDGYVLFFGRPKDEG